LRGGSNNWKPCTQATSMRCQLKIGHMRQISWR
jgi:hypothetical protein